MDDIGDIEDLFVSNEEIERLQVDHVIARVKKTNQNGTNFVNKKEYRQNLTKNESKNESKNKIKIDKEHLEINEVIHNDSISFSPGTATIFVKTWGCTHNVN